MVRGAPDGVSRDVGLDRPFLFAGFGIGYEISRDTGYKLSKRDGMQNMT